MQDKITALSRYRFEKAKEDLETADITLQHDKFDQSINRSYYAIFNALKSLLAYDMFDSKKHSSIIGYFNKQYIASGKIEQRYFKILIEAFTIRTKCDYQDFYMVSREEAENQLNNAKIFPEMIKNYLFKRDEDK